MIVVAAVASTVVLAETQYRITRELTERVREEATTWKPYKYEENPFRHDNDVRKRSGLLLHENKATNLQNGFLGQMLKTYKGLIGERQLKQTSTPVYKDHEKHIQLGLPVSFDSRNRWPGCVGAVRD